MTVPDSRPFVQIGFNDQPGFGLPGQLESGQSYINSATRSYSTEATVFCGRGIVRETIQDFSGDFPANIAPFTISVATPASIVPELVGVVNRPFTAMESFEDVDTIFKAGWAAKNVVTVVPFGSKQRVYVTQAVALGAVIYGDPVYMMIDVANSFGLQIGEFANSDGGTPAHALLVPNAIWYRSKTATASDPINTIELL